MFRKSAIFALSLVGFGTCLFGKVPVCSAKSEAAPSGAAAEVVNTRAMAPDGYYRRLHALCIGINKYQLSSIPPLSYAEADASSVAALLREQYGFADTQLLTGSQATKAGISKAVSLLFDPKRVTDDDAVLIYFAGHGQTVKPPRGGEMGFLVPQDADVDLRNPDNSGPYYDTCIPMERIREWRRFIRARHVLLIADACYSGYLAANRAIEVPRPISASLKLEVCWIITAGTKGERSQETASIGHGTFTAKLLEALQTRAADLNSDGFIRGSELGQYLRDCNFSGQTPQSQVIEGEGDFILRPLSTSNANPAPHQTPEETLSAAKPNFDSKSSNPDSNLRPNDSENSIKIQAHAKVMEIDDAITDLRKRFPAMLTNTSNYPNLASRMAKVVEAQGKIRSELDNGKFTSVVQQGEVLIVEIKSLQRAAMLIRTRKKR